MAASSRAQVLDLYRAMLRESKHFSAYNYRSMNTDVFQLIGQIPSKFLGTNEGALSVLHLFIETFPLVYHQFLEPCLWPRISADAVGTYAVRRIRDAFRENKNVKDPVEIQTLVNKAKRDLEIIRRQVHISQLYSTDKLIIENQEESRT